MPSYCTYMFSMKTVTTCMKGIFRDNINWWNSHGRKWDYIFCKSVLSLESQNFFNQRITITKIYVSYDQLTSEIWPRVMVMTHSWVIFHNCVKYYPDRISGYEVMVRTRCEQIDRRTDIQTDAQMEGQGDSYIPPSSDCGDIKTTH